MANRWMFCGGEYTMARAISGTLAVDGSGPTTYDTTYCDQGIAIRTPAGSRAALDFTDSSGAADVIGAGETGYAHAVIWNYTINNATYDLMGLSGASDYCWVRIGYHASGIALYANTNTGASPTWTQIGSAWTPAMANAKGTYDLVITRGSPHTVSAYENSVLKATGTFTSASLPDLTSMTFTCPNNSLPTVVSEAMASVGIVTLGGRVAKIKPSGAGANTGFTGAYTDIDDAAINDADYLVAATAGLKSTFAYGDLPTVPTGSTIGDVFLYTRAKNDGSAPVNMNTVIRQSGVDTSSANVSGLGIGFSETLVRYAGLTAANVNAAEFGVESVT